MITKDGRDVSIDKLTAENYLVPAGEEKYYHCIIEVERHSVKTGARISRPRVQKFTAKAFKKDLRHDLELQGYTITVLHDPTKWLEKQAAIRKAGAAERKAQEEAKFNAAVEAAVAKALAAAKKEAKESKETKPKKKEE